MIATRVATTSFFDTAGIEFEPSQSALERAVRQGRLMISFDPASPAPNAREVRQDLSGALRVGVRGGLTKAMSLIAGLRDVAQRSPAWKMVVGLIDAGAAYSAYETHIVNAVGPRGERLRDPEAFMAAVRATADLLHGAEVFYRGLAAVEALVEGRSLDDEDAYLVGNLLLPAVNAKAGPVNLDSGSAYVGIAFLAGDMAKELVDGSPLPSGLLRDQQAKLEEFIEGVLVPSARAVVDAVADTDVRARIERLAERLTVQLPGPNG